MYKPECDIYGCEAEGVWERVDNSGLRWYRCNLHVTGKE
jgi:hypothetical protein